jgi:hypothetical protein
MIAINLRDEQLSGNMKAINELKALGFSDAKIQKLYDSQVKKDVTVPLRGVDCYVKKDKEINEKSGEPTTW